MASVQVYQDEQPGIDPAPWPLRLTFDEGQVSVQILGDKPALAAWCRDLAGRLTAHAEHIEAQQEIDRRLLREAEAELTRLRRERGLPDEDDTRNPATDEE